MIFQLFNRKTPAIKGLSLMVLIYFGSLFALRAQVIDTTGVYVFSKNAEAVFLKKEEALKIKISSNRPVIEANCHEEIYYTKSNSTYSSSKVIYYSGQFESIEDIDAYTFILNGNNKGKYPVYKINTNDFLMKGVFYHDNKSKEFTFPNIQASAIGVLNYKKLLMNPQLLNKFYFSESVPVLQAKYSVSFPKSVKLSWKVFNCDDCVFTKSEDKDIITYCWQVKNVQKEFIEKNGPPVQYTAPHIVLYIQNYTLSNGVKINVLDSPKDLHTWFVSFLKKKDFLYNDELVHFTKELVKGCNTDREKAVKIFEWVQKNIEYEAFEDGLKGFIPDCETRVFTKRYGDCKGMANLLVEMLRIAELKAFHVWIGSRSIPYTFEDVPTPAATNHMIGAIELDGKMIFLDATDGYNSFSFPSGFIQGKEAMVSLSDSTFKIIKIPEVDYSENMLIDSTKVFINQGQLNGNTKLYFTGLSKSSFAHKMNNWEKDNNTNKMLTTYLNMGNNKIQTDSLVVQNVFEPNKNTFASFYFVLRDYLKGNTDYFLNLNLDKHLSDCLIDTTKRKHDWCFSHKYTHRYVTTLIIPKGYMVNALPGNSEFSSNDFGYSIHYTKKDDKVELVKTIYVNTMTLKKESFGGWNKMLNKMLKAYQENIVLQKIPLTNEK